MHDNKEQCHDCQYHNGGGVRQVKGIDDNVGQPGSCFGGQQGIAKGNAYTEENDGAPVDFMNNLLGQFTRNYTQTVKRAADNKRRYAPGWVHSTCLLRGFPKGAAPHLAHDFAEQSVVCYTLCRRCPENTVAAGEGKGV